MNLRHRSATDTSASTAAAYSAAATRATATAAAFPTAATAAVDSAAAPVFKSGCFDLVQKQAGVRSTQGPGGRQGSQAPPSRTAP
jgi:hypothetical protein